MTGHNVHRCTGMRSRMLAAWDANDSWSRMGKLEELSSKSRMSGQQIGTITGDPPKEWNPTDLG
jgi:hypothetical protein